MSGVSTHAIAADAELLRRTAAAAVHVGQETIVHNQAEVVESGTKRR